jgi:hypothetical protein
MSWRMSTAAGELSFDPRTGQTSYVQQRSLVSHLRALTPRPVGWLLAAGALWVAFEAAQWGLLRARIAALRRRARQCTELEDLAALLYSIAPAHLGGFLTNATVQAVERVGDAGSSSSDGSGVLIFASGGWRFTPHSLAAVPSAVPFPAEGSSGDEQRLLWWLSITLGKGTVLNGSLAFLIASLLMRQEKEQTPEQLCLRHRGRRITNVGLTSGALYNNLTPLQGAAAAAAAASSSAAAGASTTAASACLPPSLVRRFTPVTRLDLVCEIGTLVPARVVAFARANWGMTPDPRSEALAEVADMGTSAVLAFWRRHRRLPQTSSSSSSTASSAAAAASPDEVEMFGQRVLWEKRAITPPSGKDCWLFVELEPLHPGGEPERMHVDLSLHFARGISAGWQEDREQDASTTTQLTARSPRSTWNNLCRTVSRWSRRVLSRLPTALRPVHLSSSSPLPTASLPRPLLLPDSLVHSSSVRSGLNARVVESSVGPRETLALLQKLVLINSEGPNAVHAQMRALLLEALDLCQLRNKYLTVKIPPAPAPKPKRRTAAEVVAEWTADAHSKVPPQSSNPRAHQGRSAKQRAKRRAAEAARKHDDDSDDEEQAEQEQDEDDVVDIDTATVGSSEADQVD